MSPLVRQANCRSFNSRLAMRVLVKKCAHDWEEEEEEEVEEEVEKEE